MSSIAHPIYEANADKIRQRYRRGESKSWKQPRPQRPLLSESFPTIISAYQFRALAKLILNRGAARRRAENAVKSA